MNEMLSEIKKEYTELELKRIRYTLTVLFYEITKLILLITIFSFAGKLKALLICMAVIMPVRIFSGGLHFNHYWSCFLFTLLFFAVPVFVFGNLIIPPHDEVISLCFITLLIWLIGPISSAKRPTPSYKNYQKFRYLTVLFLFGYTLCFLFFPNMPYRTPVYRIIVLHFIQLCLAHIQAFSQKRERYIKE